MNPPATSQWVILLVVLGILLFAMGGLASVVYLITIKADGVLIAVVSGPTGTALGGLMSVLNNTRSTPTNGVKTNV